MKELVGMGFVKVGDWVLQGNGIDFSLQKESDKNKVLYSFIENNTIVYIGQSTNTLHKRMYQYKNPDSTQETNVRVNDKIKKSLKEGKRIEIYAIEYDDSFAKDLLIETETRLIDSKRPIWNKQGK
ncbi:hypothetical protein FACS1894141_7440 [Spirochaetia bacterium]|nr:hypothetical protein FACS1894141_7440 [Spirochaetia bacterium]